MGSYQGKFRRVVAAPPPGKFAKYGWRSHYESFGQRSYDEVAYLGVQSFNRRQLGIALGAALWRRILKRYSKLEISDPREALGMLHITANNLTAQFDPLPKRVVWIDRYRATGTALWTIAQNAWEQNLGKTSTLLSLAEDWCDNVFMSANFGAGGGLNAELYGYRVDTKDLLDTAYADLTRYGPMERVYDLNVKLYSLVSVTVQNVTVADDIAGDNRDADRIDRNPIVGRILRFNELTPVLNHMRGAFQGANTTYNEGGATRLTLDANGDGLIIPENVMSGKWTQLPKPDQFLNCTGVANVALEPGAMKKMVLKFKYNGTLSRLMTGMTDHEITSPYRVAGVRRNQLGTCQLIAFEKRMSTGAAQVTLNFQVDRHYGCVLGRNRPVTLDTYNEQGVAAATDVPA